jgi:hypothetical protein
MACFEILLKAYYWSERQRGNYDVYTKSWQNSKSLGRSRPGSLEYEAGEPVTTQLYVNAVQYEEFVEEEVMYLWSLTWE